MTEKKIIRAKAPAKIILSGEHAVVYGQPALVMAIDLYTISKVCWSSPLHFTFNLLGIDFKQKMTLEALKRLKRNLRQQYQKFSNGTISIREVLKHPFELTLYTAINVIDKLKHNLPMGINFDSQSTIPVGAGLGSSAACVVSLITALSHFLDADIGVEDYIRLGIESENLQHGLSSGIDVRISHSGGCCYYHNGLLQPRPLPKFPMLLVLTGQAQSSTGECVNHTKAIFESSNIANDFMTITRAFDNAVQENNLRKIQDCIRQNHKLLNRIGVVPNKPNDFIQAIEAQGGAAKICGAGAIRGEAVGAILVVSETPCDELIKKYGYKLLSVKGDDQGASIL